MSHCVVFSVQQILLCDLFLESPNVSSPSVDSLDFVADSLLVIVGPCDGVETYPDCDFYSSGRGINPEMSLVSFSAENDLHSFVFVVTVSVTVIVFSVMGFSYCVVERVSYGVDCNPEIPLISSGQGTNLRLYRRSFC